MQVGEKHLKDKIILIPYAEIADANSGVNISCNNKRQEIYLKNCCVSACSAKQNNPDSDVAVITNIQFPATYAKILEQNDVSIINVPFDRFWFGNTYTWSLAFYKLCAIYHIVRKHEYKYYAYLDADVVVQSSFTNIWTECDEHIMLYDISHGLQVQDYRIFLQEIESFVGRKTHITHFGGEFFASNRQNALLFTECCESIYQKMMDRDFHTSKGDEFILSLAAETLKANIKNASAYIYRFWTGSFNLTSTCYQFNPVTILHTPGEKERGIIKLFDKYYSKEISPSRKVIHGVLHLKKPALRVRISAAKNRIFAKLKGIRRCV